jgi:hypothetical protein
MSELTASKPSIIGKRGLVLLAALTAAAAMLFSATAPKASAATEYQFCHGVNLAPYGQYGDRCNAWGGGYLAESKVYSWEHSVCIDYTNGVDSNLMYPWACGDPPLNGIPSFRFVNFWNDGIYRKPIIRNNTTGDDTVAYGWYSCYTNC